MTAKKALTDEELLAQFDDIPAQDATPNSSESSNSKSSDSQHVTSGPEDPLADLEILTKRAHTPKTSTLPVRPPKSDAVTPSSTTSARTSEEKSSQSLPNTTVPGTAVDTTSPESKEEKAALRSDDDEKRLAEANKSNQQQQKDQAGGGWWGGIIATASAAVKQAETAVKEIQKTEEAQRWTEQVKGNVGALRDLGMCSFYSLFFATTYRN